MEEIQQAEERAREEEENRAAAARALGTAVTAETFAAWRKRFDAEREAQGMMLGSVYRGDGDGAQAAMCADGERSVFLLNKRGKERERDTETEEGEEENLRKEKNRLTNKE